MPVQDNKQNVPALWAKWGVIFGIFVLWLEINPQKNGIKVIKGKKVRFIVNNVLFHHQTHSFMYFPFLQVKSIERMESAMVQGNLRKPLSKPLLVNPKRSFESGLFGRPKGVITGGGEGLSQGQQSQAFITRKNFVFSDAFPGGLDMVCPCSSNSSMIFNTVSITSSPFSL